MPGVLGSRQMMIHCTIWPVILRIVLFAILTVQLTGCNVDSNSGNAGTGATDSASAVEISGSVGDGPVTGATIVVYAANGSELGSMTSDKTAFFRSTVMATGGDYPLLIKATGGFDLVTGAAPSLAMWSVMLSSSDKRQNVNPFTTLIVKTAQALPGGLSANNIKAARTAVNDTLAFGLDPNLIPDPITTPIDASRAANMIKSSEVMAEMVRRTAAILSRGGTQISGDGVLAALAADLTDGYLDGRGAGGADARIATVAEVVSSQVLMEALRNELKVDGVVASGTLDAAIRTTQPGVSASQLTAGVRATAGMLEQATVAVAAARVLDSSSQLADIAASVGSIAPNSLPTAVKQVLSADATTYLDSAVTLSPRATTQQMRSIGQVVHGSSGVSASSAGSSVSTSGSGSTRSLSSTTATVAAQTQAAATGTITLKWKAPVARADGTPLSLADIDGYQIHYGKSVGNYTSQVNVPDGTAQTVTLTDIPVGTTYYLVMSTYDVDGRQSGYSAMVSKSVQ